MKNKRNRVMAIGFIVLALAIVTSCIAGFTYAKYITTTGGTSTSGEVALWQWEIAGSTINSVEAADSGFQMDLFNDTQRFDLTAEGNVDTSAETDVASGKIAPGVGGKFDFVIKNKSEVNGSYSLDFSATLNDIPVAFSTDNANWGDIDSIDKNATNISMEEQDTIVIYWRWKFDGDNEADTALGFNGSATATVTANATFTQID